MKNDKKIRNVISDIGYQCNQYLDFVGTLNECAYSDRYLEKIIEKTKILENLYNKQFGKDKKIEREKER